MGIGLQNRALRRQLNSMHMLADELFVRMCDDTAERALSELWGSGAFDCGPQDYDYIVEQCLAAIRELQRRTKPAAVSH